MIHISNQNLYFVVVVFASLIWQATNRRIRKYLFLFFNFKLKVNKNFETSEYFFCQNSKYYNSNFFYSLFYN